MVLAYSGKLVSEGGGTHGGGEAAIEEAEGKWRRVVF